MNGFVDVWWYCRLSDRVGASQNNPHIYITPPATLHPCGKAFTLSQLAFHSAGRDMDRAVQNPENVMQELLY
jgi:hypothetical protein